MPPPEKHVDLPAKWIPAKLLQAGDVIILRQQPPLLMPVTGVKVHADIVLVENPLHGKTQASPEMKIRIQINANTTSVKTT
jgi:hypothetical protein